jgi:glycosyltransferase involved in cell wall biosynthesis
MIVKDSEETVKQTLESIASQTYPHDLLEIIIVDGGSKDKTLSIIDETMHDSTADIPMSIYSDDGRGLGYARQMVIIHAKGDYVLWVDSDATIQNDYASSLVEFVESHPQCAGARGIQEVSNKVGLLARLESLSLVLERTSRHIYDTNGQIVRVQAVKQVGGFDTHIRGAGEDVDLVLRMERAGWKFSVIEKTELYHTICPWRQFFQKRVRSGYGYHYRLHNRTVVKVLWDQMFPITLLVGLNDARSAYRLTRQKASFLLPFWYCIRSIPWFIGFGKSHIDGYGHRVSR